MMRIVLAWLRGWRTSPPIEGKWYLVTNGKWVAPAVSYKSAAGGWSNLDTWEDFDREVIAWKRLRIPQPPRRGDS